MGVSRVSSRKMKGKVVDSVKFWPQNTHLFILDSDSCSKWFLLYLLIVT